MKNLFKHSLSKPGALLSLSLLCAWNLHGEPIESVVAIVNNEPILQSDVTRLKKNLESNQVNDDVLFPNAEEKRKALTNPDYLMQKLIDEKLVNSEIKRLDMSATEEQVQGEIRGIAKSNNMTMDQLKEQMRLQGMSFDEYQTLIRRSLERRSLFGKEIASRVKISDEEVNSEFVKRNKDLPQSSFEYQIARILISIKGRSEKQALERGNMIFEKYKKGESFEQLAADYSEDPAFTTGGTLGTFKANELNPAYELVLRPLDVNEVSKPFVTSEGIILLKTLAKKLIPDPRSENARNEIRGELFNLALQRQVKIWLEQKRRLAFIRINK